MLVYWATLLLPLLAASLEENGTLRTIPQGQINGTVQTTRLGRAFYSFYKIPYAKPPLGPLRFKKPVAAEGWSGIRDATVEDRTICPTRNIYVKGKFFFQGEEDCLYLNVYSPAEMGARRLPVMFYIHGGGWVSGSGNSLYYPPQYLLDKDIVLVIPNYRLGALGFLSMGDEKLSGNWGLKDQTLALQWVKDNIEFFGGDPRSVTIFGESAGGSSVHFHMLSPLSRGLFHRAISQSGTGLTSWSLSKSDTTRKNSIKLASLLECPTSDSDTLAECLRSKPIKDIIEQDVHFMEWITDPMIPFKPVVEKQAKPDEAFLPEHPEDAIRGGRVADVPWMTGFTNGDGAIRSSSIYDNETLVRDLDERFEEIVPMSLFIHGENRKDVARKMRAFYIGGQTIGDHNYLNVTNLWTDGWFGIGTGEAVKLHTTYTTSPVYYYYFSYRGQLSFSSVFGDSTRDYGVCHADELFYLFPMVKDFANHVFNKEDNQMVDTLTEMWTNFAITGKPLTKTINWSPVKTSDLEYLHISQTGAIMEKNLLPERFKFWSNLNLTHDEL